MPQPCFLLQDHPWFIENPGYIIYGYAKAQARGKISDHKHAKVPDGSKDTATVVDAKWILAYQNRQKPG